jgi:hypothetical protein
VLASICTTGIPERESKEYGGQNTLEEILLTQLLRRQRSGGSWFKPNLGKKVNETPYQSISQAWWHAPVIPATWETIGRRFTV